MSPQVAKAGRARGYLAAPALALILAMLLQACAGASSGGGEPPLDIAGSWSGASFPGCRSNGGVNCYHRPIAFVLACPVGNMMCGTDNSGKAENGRITGSYRSDLRVIFSDATNCLYQGEFAGDAGNGEYMCFAGAGRIVEQGGWHLERAPQ